MKIETTLGTVIAIGTVMFVAGEVVGYYRCKQKIEEAIIEEIVNIRK